MKKKIVGLIPVKGDLTELKKEYKKICEFLLFLRKLNQLKQTKYFDEIIVSSEDRKF